MRAFHSAKLAPATPKAIVAEAARAIVN